MPAAVEHRLVARAADLEEDQALVLELDLLVVDPARQDHRPVHAGEVLRPMRPPRFTSGATAAVDRFCSPHYRPVAFSCVRNYILGIYNRRRLSTKQDS